MSPETEPSATAAATEHSSISADEHSDGAHDDTPSAKNAGDKKKSGTPAGSKEKKTRASRACQSCRNRKVRCDVATLIKTMKLEDNIQTLPPGAKCHNCATEGIECVLLPQKRKKERGLSASIKGSSNGLSQNPLSSQSPQTPPVLLRHPVNGRPYPYSTLQARPSRDGIMNPNDMMLKRPYQQAFASGQGNEYLDGRTLDDEPMSDDVRERSNGLSPTIAAAELPTQSHPLYSMHKSQRPVPAGEEDDLEFGTGSIEEKLAELRKRNQEREYGMLLTVSTMPGSYSAIGGDIRALAERRAELEAADRIRRSHVPPYLRRISQTLPKAKKDYLIASGALQIPADDFRNELLRCFVEYVHPYMPVLDLQEFLRIIQEGTGASGQLSLLLFQAVMFAGMAFVDKKWWEDSFPDRISARRAFFEKTRALYDFDYEDDRLHLIQSLLLMTYWYDSPKDQKDTWHWMGVAISQAHTIGLHRDSSAVHMDEKRRKLLKRVWWSCYMRDRLIALGMRRPTRIKAEDYNVPMLELGDFEIELLSPDNTIISPECTLLRSLEMQADMARLCVAKIELCACISHVLTTQYSTVVRQYSDTDPQAQAQIMVLPRKDDHFETVQDCGKELLNWNQKLDERSKYVRPSSEELIGSTKSLVVQKALLQMTYWATVSALYRPIVLPSAGSVAGPASSMRQESRRYVNNASDATTVIAHDMDKLGLVQYLPTTAVTVLIPAIIVHLLNVRGVGDKINDDALKGFRKCFVVLKQLRTKYMAAHFAQQFLDAAVVSTGIKDRVDEYYKATSNGEPIPTAPNVLGNQELARGSSETWERENSTPRPLSSMGVTPPLKRLRTNESTYPVVSPLPLASAASPQFLGPPQPPIEQDTNSQTQVVAPQTNDYTSFLDFEKCAPPSHNTDSPLSSNHPPQLSGSNAIDEPLGQDIEYHEFDKMFETGGNGAVGMMDDLDFGETGGLFADDLGVADWNFGFDGDGAY